MINYIDDWKDEITLSDRATPRQVRCKKPVLTCDACGANTEDDPHLVLKRYCDADLCEECFAEIAWQDAEEVEAEVEVW